MTFVPQRTAISAITQANPCVVTTEEDHNLTSEQKVRLHVPPNYGMSNLDQGLFSVTVITPTTFSLQYTQVPPAQNVDSTLYPAFTIPSNPQFTAEVLAVGSGPAPVIEPQVYQLNNVCISDVLDATLNNSTTEIPF